MPHLDANALTTDADGLAFLQDIIGTPAVTPARHAFEPSRPTTRMKRVRSLETEPARPQRRKRVVSEAA